MDRRRFLKRAAATAGAAAGGAKAAPSQRVIVAVMGVNGRGRDLAVGFAAEPSAEVAYVCDVDERAIEKCLAAVSRHQANAPQPARDFRRVLDDRSVDALAIAAPDHWHAPATILACEAGKHVYVEKPASHNPREGELMVAAARKHNRVVQLGTQRRSAPGIIEAVETLRAGAVGRVTLARGWYNNTRPSIGRGKVGPVPGWLDYDLWQGPAPRREYRDNVVHYNWHWFWHWGTGELGNNGIHALDVCRWGLGVDYPQRVTAAGGRFRYPDDWETPDTHLATFEFGDRMITWEGRSCHPRGFEGSTFGAAFYGEGGTLVITDGGYRVIDLKDREAAAVPGGLTDPPHLRDFLDCVRSLKRPRADIEEGHKSTLLCHLGNIALRTGRTLKVDPKSGQILGDREAAALWSREYRKGWEPKV